MGNFFFFYRLFHQLLTDFDDFFILFVNHKKKSICKSQNCCRVYIKYFLIFLQYLAEPRAKNNIV